jgi:hypothetical protein
MKNNGYLNWDISKISNALKLSEEDTRKYFTDGRRVSFLIERRVAYEILQGKLAASEGAGYDVIDKGGKKWEVRSLTKSGIYFCPSYMVGSGRKFEEKGFIEKLKEIEGYIISDISEFPQIPFWIINKSEILNLYNKRQLGTGTKVTYAKMLEIINKL